MYTETVIALLNSQWITKNRPEDDPNWDDLVKPGFTPATETWEAISDRFISVYKAEELPEPSPRADFVVSTAETRPADPWVAPEHSKPIPAVRSSLKRSQSRKGQGSTTQTSLTRVMKRKPSHNWTIKELQRMTGFTYTTTHSALRRMVSKGTVTQTPGPAGAKGRPIHLYTFNG